MNQEINFDDYPRPSLAVDPAIITSEDGSMWSVLWRRQGPPHENEWALPGVFVNEGESLEDAVLRAIRDKVGITGAGHIEQLFAWNKHGRDPRGWVVTIAYYLLIPFKDLKASIEGRPDVGLFRLQVGKGVKNESVHFSSETGEVIVPAFDHAEILKKVTSRLQDQIWTSSLAFPLLQKKFSLRDMKKVYESILGTKLNKDSFRNRVVNTLQLVKSTGTFEKNVDHRPGELFTRRGR